MGAERSRLLQRLSPLIIVLVAVAAYWNCFRGPFVFDDREAILRNPQIRQVWPLTVSMKTPPQTAVAARPVTQLSFALNYWIAGFHVPYWKAGNLLVHVCSCLLLFGIVRRLIGSVPLALASAVLYAVHPLNSEVINYITQRTESMMGMFALLTAYAFIRRWYAVSVIACALGMGCKEPMVVVPALVLAMDRIFLSRSWREVKWPVHVALFATLGVMLYLQMGNPHSEIYDRPPDLNSWTYLLTETGVILHYLRQVFWPWPLVIDYYDWPLAHSLSDVLLPAIVVLGLFILTIYALLRWPKVGFVGLCFFFILAPTSSIVPLTGEYASDRRMYLPLAVIIPLILVAAWQWLKRAPAWAGVLVVIVLAAPMIYACNLRNRDYRTSVSIWADAVEKRPRSARAWGNLAAALLVDGDTKDAAFAARRAIEILPQFYVNHRVMGDIYSEQGEFDQAINELHVAQSLKDDVSVRRSLALAYEKHGDRKAAMYWFDRALELRPNDPTIRLERQRVATENEK